jgi:phospholipid/cholesterol/gamma-HCH transport system permease protein
MFSRTLAAARRDGLAWRAILRELVVLGWATVPLVVMGLSFFGMAIVVIAWHQARKYTGNVTVLGPPYFVLIVREFAPLCCGLLLASRAGAKISAELAAMSVEEQIEALELCGVDPLAELVAPRVVAGALALPLLTVIGTAASTIAAMATVSLRFGADGLAFVDPRFVTSADVACAAIKSVLTGLAIPIIAAWRGLRARHGASSVGAAVTSAVVDACLGCLLIDFTVGAAFLLLGG